jgi:hypothetical protein
MTVRISQAVGLFQTPPNGPKHNGPKSGTDAIHKVRCGIRHSSASTRRAYASGLAGECHEAVQFAGVAKDAEEAPGQDAAIEKGSEFLLDKARYMPLVILL